MTGALGYAFAAAPNFSISVLRAAGLTGTPSEVRLERRREVYGRTDVEVVAGDCLLVIEAKLGFAEPSPDQITRYAASLKAERDAGAAGTTALICLTGWADDIASQRIPSEELGSRIFPLSWRRLLELARSARTHERQAGRSAIDDLVIFLQRVVSMTDVDSNLVYVVSISRGVPTNAPKDRGYTWKSLVTDHSVYWHPIGGGPGGWPSNPPNYLGFRWDKRLQEVRHVEDHVLFRDPHEVLSEFAPGEFEPHILYRLGPPIRPQAAARSDGLWPSGRYWVALDLLLICDSIKEARDKTIERRTSRGQAIPSPGLEAGL